ncbi:hypothetical protein GCM10008022_47100 [Paenibacillus hunanensis]|nr:hypothetical protein GCM10008022_47100 [Paenibacillus hunanensis]
MFAWFIDLTYVGRKVYGVGWTKIHITFIDPFDSDIQAKNLLLTKKRHLSTTKNERSSTKQ